MEHQEKWQEQIDRYLKNLMSVEEKNVFMEKVNNNSDLAKELGLQQDLFDGVRTLGNRGLKAKLKNIHAEVINEKQNTPTKSRRLIIWTISAAAAVLLLLFIFKTIQSTPISNSELFAQHYQAYELNGQSRNGDANAMFIQATTVYKRKKYTEAATLFNTILEQDPQNTNVMLALGICQLELNQFDQALLHFQKVTELKDPFLEDRALWYSALTYLKNEQISSCKELLTTISLDASNDYNKEAKDLLQDLD